VAFVEFFRRSPLFFRFGIPVFSSPDNFTALQTMTITIDIGGEGSNSEAWNVNPSRVKTVGPRAGTAIPRLIQARGDALPFADGSIGQVIVERTPFPRTVAREVARVLAQGGRVTLRHVRIPGRDRHAAAKQLIAGTVSESIRQSGTQTYQETVVVNR